LIELLHGHSTEGRIHMDVRCLYWGSLCLERLRQTRTAAQFRYC